MKHIAVISTLALIIGCSTIQKAYVPVVTQDPVSGVLTTNWTTNSRVVAGINTVTQVGGAINPWAAAAGLLVSVIYGAGATILNLRKNKTVTQLTKAGTVLTENIDTAKDMLGGQREVFKDKIADKQDVAGVRSTIEKLRK